MPAIESLITLVIYVVVLGALCWLLMWAIDAIPVPEPLRTVARVVIIVVMVLIAIYLLMGLLPPFPRRT